jgi:hypothetical protein
MNALKALEGKTIEKVTVEDHDIDGNDERVGQKITVVCQGGETLEFFADGGPGSGWYATVIPFSDVETEDDPDEDEDEEDEEDEDDDL